jgi:hypothetical protein
MKKELKSGVMPLAAHTENTDTGVTDTRVSKQPRNGGTG